MEIVLLLLVLFLAGQKDARIQSLPPLDLLKGGDWKKFVHSEWFQGQTLGGVSGKEIAQAADAVETIQKYGDTLKPLLNGDFSALSSLTGADELFKNLGGIASLAQGAGGLGSLFGGAAGTFNGAGAFGGSAENNAPEGGEEAPFAPIANIADAEIIYALTRYFA